MTRLVARAEDLGARVEWVRIVGPHAGAYDLSRRTIYLDWDLDSRPRHAVSTLAHELAHHVYQDAGFGDVWVERRADVWAARWLICPGRYRRVERMYDGDPYLIAQDLGVTTRLVHAFQGTLVPVVCL